MARLDLVIIYDPADEGEALALARRLFAHYDESIDSLTLSPAPDADFTLALNGALVHSQQQSGRAPRVADLRAVLEKGNR